MLPIPPRRPQTHQLTLSSSFPNLQFKCHRETSPSKKTQTDIYAVNAVSFSPAHDDIFATGGSDGTFVVWDVVRRSRLRTFPKVSGPVTAMTFSRDGMTLAYAIGYDWAKGYQHSTAGPEKKIVVHCFKEPLKGK